MSEEVSRVVTRTPAVVSGDVSSFFDTHSTPDRRYFRSEVVSWSSSTSGSESVEGPLPTSFLSDGGDCGHGRGPSGTRRSRGGTYDFGRPGRVRVSTSSLLGSRDSWTSFQVTGHGFWPRVCLRVC